MLVAQVDLEDKIKPDIPEYLEETHCLDFGYHLAEERSVLVAALASAEPAAAKLLPEECFLEPVVETEELRVMEPLRLQLLAEPEVEVEVEEQDSTEFLLREEQVDLLLLHLFQQPLLLEGP